MSDLVQAYKRYYRNQDLKSLDFLFNSIINYDFKSYNYDLIKIFKFWIETSCHSDFLEMKSNGSTATPTPYIFGPNPHGWLQKIERYLRLRQNKTILIFTYNFGAKHSPRFIATQINSSQRDFEATGNYAIDENMDQLLRFLDDCCINFETINLVSHPNIWIFLTTNTTFRDWVAKNFSKIGAFVNTDWDASFKDTGVYCRDQMIDWKSGVNFYTCQYGHKHFLPIFFREGNHFYNLLNLSHFKSNIDDLIDIKDNPQICLCGKNRLDFTILPHFKNRIVDIENKIVDLGGIYNELEHNYQNLQIFQDLEGSIKVCYASKTDVSSDLLKIESFLRSKKLEKISFESSKYFQIGRKRYSIWKGDASNIELKDFTITGDSK